MKIALLRPLPDRQRWSMDLYSQELANAIRSQLNSHESLILFPEGGNIPNHKFQKWGQQYWQYGRWLQEVKADVYHITDHGYANLLPFLKGRKTVVTFHDALLPNLQQKTLPVSWQPHTAIWAQQYALRCLRTAGRVITVSEFSKKEFLRFNPSYPEEKVHAIHEFISPAFLQKISPQQKEPFLAKYNLTGRSLILLPGRSEPHKNVEGSLRVFARFLQQSPQEPWTLVKIGSPLTNKQRGLVHELKLNSHVVEIHDLPQSELPVLYQASRLVLFLSWYEGFGLPVLEAMASGTPILISNRGSLPEVAGPETPQVDPTDEAKAMIWMQRLLLEVKLRDEIIDKGRKWLMRYSWEKTASRTLEVYQRLYDQKMA